MRSQKLHPSRSQHHSEESDHDVRDGKVYASGAATFGTTAAGPSSVIAYNRATGAQTGRFDTKGENCSPSTAPGASS